MLALVAAVGLGALALRVAVDDALGAEPGGDRLDRIERSSHVRGDRFINTLPTISDGASVGTIWAYLFGGSEVREPRRRGPVPVVRRTAADFAGPAPDLRVTWFGHSSLLLEVDGARVLVDPVWGQHAAPAAVFGVERFYAPPLVLSALPALDAVVISHDHYDHLDLPTVQALADRVPRWVVPLGVGSHLEAWGVAPGRITELDWWEETEVGDVRLVATPARHFSGRGLGDRDATLWSGWAVVGPEHRVFYSGDTALTPAFNEVGERLGPFDITLIEAGGYDAAWADLHLGPEQAVAVHQMVRGELMIPVHWALFDLALHGWTEPAERVRAAARRAEVDVAFPRPGESVTLDAIPTEPWWPEVPWQTSIESPVVSTGLPDSVRALVP